MKRLYWVGAFLLYAAFLAALAPAGTLLWGINLLGNNKIMAESTSGTLWHGEARGMTFAPQGRPAAAIGRISWKIRPLKLLLGKVETAVELSGNGIRGQGLLGFGSQTLSIRQLDATLPAAWLAYLQPTLNGWQIDGTLKIRSNEFSLQSNRFSGRAEITWEQAALGISPVRPLGTYHGEISGTGQEMQILLQTLSGPLQVAGKGIWSPSAGFAFNGTAKALAREAELRNLLGLIGKPGPNNRYAIKL